MSKPRSNARAITADEHPSLAGLYLAEKPVRQAARGPKPNLGGAMGAIMVERDAKSKLFQLELSLVRCAIIAA
jgi:hypothetical protein